MLHAGSDGKYAHASMTRILLEHACMIRTHYTIVNFEWQRRPEWAAALSASCARGGLGCHVATSRGRDPRAAAGTAGELSACVAGRAGATQAPGSAPPGELPPGPRLGRAGTWRATATGMARRAGAAMGQERSSGRWPPSRPGPAAASALWASSCTPVAKSRPVSECRIASP
jgi:hypothetical protein